MIGKLLRLTEEIIKKERKVKFYKQFVKKNSTVFDIGANIGDRTQVLSRLGANVIAVEPQDDCCAILRKRFKNKVTIVQMGVGEKQEIKTMYISKTNVLSSFSTEWIETLKETRFKSHTWDTIKSVEITTLDLLIQQYGKPRFIKIDVEGYDFEVLKGLNYEIPYISFEYCTPERDDSTIQTLEFLKKANSSLKCNYSVAETMKLSLREWINIDSMMEIITTNNFKKTDFGDIYLKNEKVKC
jgi:FkbM family methyltransferase